MYKTFSSGSIPPLRPIVSSIDTYNYKLAHYLGSLLSPHIPSNFTTKDSFTFIEEIKQLNTYGKFLISFDVTSLFNISQFIPFLKITLTLNSLEKNFKSYLK